MLQQSYRVGGRTVAAACIQSIDLVVLVCSAQVLRSILAVATLAAAVEHLPMPCQWQYLLPGLHYVLC
jgi:hypothetical protein